MTIFLSSLCARGQHRHCSGLTTKDLVLCTCDCHKTSIADLTDLIDDPVNHPSHYTSDPSGIECIEVTRHRNFNIGNAMKYLWRAGLKTDGGDAKEKEIEDIRKAIWYLNDEIGRLEREK